MTRYFAQNTPRAGLEHMMMSVPGFQKRGGGMMILSRFCYKPEDVDCRYCLHYRRRSCQVRTCPYIAERLKSGAIEYLDLILEYFGHIPHAGLHKRIQAVEHWSGPDQAVLHTVSVHLRSRFADRVWDDAPPGYLAALYLLASKERLWQPALPALSHDSIDFSRIVSKPHGFAIQDYDNGMKLEQLYDGRHFPCYHYQPNLLAVGLSSRQEPENTDQITWLLLPCSEQQLQRGIARSGVNIHDARIWYEDSLLPSEVEEVLEGQREDLFALNDMATAIAALSDLEQKKLTAVMEMAKPECAGEIRELAKNLELFEFAPKVRTPAEYGRYMIQDSGHYEYDPNLEEFYDYERYGKLRMEKETGAFTEKGYVAYCGTLTLGELMAGGPAEQHQREQEFQMGGM